MANVVELTIQAVSNVRAVSAEARSELSGLAAAAKKAGGDISAPLAALGSRSGAFSVTAAALGTAAIATAGAIALIGAAAIPVAVALGNMATAAEDAVNAASRVSGSASTLQGLSQAMSDAGLNAGSLTQGLRFLSVAISRNDPLLAKYGATSRDTTTALLQLAGGFSRATDANVRQADAVKLLGRGSSELIPLLVKGGDALSTQIDRYREWGTVLDDVRLARLAKYDDTLDEVNARFAGLRNELAVALLPAFETFGGALIGVLEILNRFVKKIGEAVDATARLREAASGGNLGEGLRRFFSGALPSDVAGRSSVGTTGTRQPTQNEIDAARKESERLAAVVAALKDARDKIAGGTESDSQAREAKRLGKDALTPEEASLKRLMDGLKGANKEALDALAKGLQAVAENSTQLTEAGRALANLPLDIGTLTSSLERDVPNSLRSTFDAVLAGTESFGSAFTSLWRGILDDIKHALVDSFIESSGVQSLIRRGIGAFVGFVTGGPVGAVAGAAGSGLLADRPLAIGGGASNVTFNVTATDAASFFESANGINGRIRRAMEQAERLAGA